MTSDRRGLLRGRAPLVAGAVVTAVIVGAAAILRLAVDYPVATPLPERLLGVLASTALLLGALLALPRSPGIAWALLALSAGFGALEVVGVVRALEPLVAGPAARDLTLLAGAALAGATAVAAGYAARTRARRSRIGRIAVLVVALGVAGTAFAWVWAAFDAGGVVPAAPTGDLTPRRIAGRIGLVALVLAIAVGLARDLGPPTMRAASRLRTAPRTSERGRLWQLLDNLADELLPARAADRGRVAEAERARLAADLHALVLPDLRRAAAAAESAGAPSEVQVDLRRALEDVEQLMHQRQSVVLEQFGLVAALEWLAERTEERSPLRVELELDGNVPEGPDSIDPVVARAAFRIALLGLDNVVRHASATTATLRLSRDGGGLRLVVLDDGQSTTGFDTTGGRGLADMRAEAKGSGGSIAFVAGTGARIEAAWPLPRLAGNAATGPAHVADRSDISAP